MSERSRLLGVEEGGGILSDGLLMTEKTQKLAVRTQENMQVNRFETQEETAVFLNTSYTLYHENIIIIEY